MICIGKLDQEMQRLIVCAIFNPLRSSILSLRNGGGNTRGVGATHPGTDVMIFKIFSPKNSAKKLALLTPNKAKF
jgi:hypothetical protein